MTQRSREETIQQDVRDLHQLGYAQELFRSMGGFSNFAISFSIISILTGAVILYDYGLAWAGTAASLIGWPLVTIFVLAIAASMAEVASAYPTAGGLYYWASRMKGVVWGWWTAWLNLIGQFAIVAGIAYAAAQFLNVAIVTPVLSNFGVAYGNTTEFIKAGDTPILTGALVTMGILLAICLVLRPLAMSCRTSCSRRDSGLSSSWARGPPAISSMRYCVTEGCRAALPSATATMPRIRSPGDPAFSR